LNLNSSSYQNINMTECTDRVLDELLTKVIVCYVADGEHNLQNTDGFKVGPASRLVPSEVKVCVRTRLRPVTHILQKCQPCPCSDRS
jgi:hypothetical protein